MVRLTHWLIAVSVFIMTGSGWRIYDWSPLIEGTHIPTTLTLGGNVAVSRLVHNEDGLAGALQWHFLGMWLLLGSFGLYLLYGLFSGYFRAMWVPIDRHALGHDLALAAKFRLSHSTGVRSSLQSLLYAVVSGAIVLTMLSGLAMWKPIQLDSLTMLLGGYEAARIIHFIGMLVIVGFVVLHLAAVALMAKSRLSASVVKDLARG